MDAAEDFEKWLDQTVGPLPEGSQGEPLAEGASHFRIESDDLAEWALRKIRRVQREISSRAEFIEKQKSLLTTWQESLDVQAQRTQMFFEGLLHGYLLRLQESGKLGRKKSWALPNGTLQLRISPPQYAVVDAAAFLAWCQDHQLTEVVITPKWGEAKKRFSETAHGVEAIDRETGEVIADQVPGIIVARPERETFSVKLVNEKEGA